MSTKHIFTTTNSPVLDAGGMLICLHKNQLFSYDEEADNWAEITAHDLPSGVVLLRDRLMLQDPNDSPLEMIKGNLRSSCCKAELRVVVQVSLNIPFDMAHQLTKAKIRRSEVQIEAANWGKALYECSKCHRVSKL